MSALALAVLILLGARTVALAHAPNEVAAAGFAPADAHAGDVGPEPPAWTRCTPPLRADWAQRDADEAWLPGLYPATEPARPGRVALTFDDGPMRSTGDVLDELARAGLHAAFFVTGWSIKPRTYHHVQRAVADGHLLGNHGWRHDADMAARYRDDARLEAYIAAELELTQIRVDLALLAESPEHFARMDRAVFEGLTIAASHDAELAAVGGVRERHAALLAAHGYRDGARPYPLRWVRPPGGNPYLGARFRPAQRDAFARAAAQQGLHLAMWSVGSRDSDPTLSPAERMDPERIARSIRRTVRRGGIYVAHDRVTRPALQAIVRTLAQLRDAGAADVVTLDAMLTDKYVHAGRCPALAPPPSAPAAPVADPGRASP